MNSSLHLYGDNLTVGGVMGVTFYAPQDCFKTLTHRVCGVAIHTEQWVRQHWGSHITVHQAALGFTQHSGSCSIAYHTA